MDGQCLPFASIDLPVRILEGQVIGILADMEGVQHIVLKLDTIVFFHKGAVIILAEQFQHVVLMEIFHVVGIAYTGIKCCKIGPDDTVICNHLFFHLIV